MASITIAGIITGTLNTFGIFDSQSELNGSIDGIFNASGNLDVLTKLGSAVIEISGVGGFLGEIEIATKLRGLTNTVSGINGYLNFRFLSIPIAAISGASGAFDFTYSTYERSEEDAQPIELYLFNQDNGAEYWSYTSTDYDIIYNGRTYKAALIRRSPIRLTANSLKTQLEIETDLYNPFIREFIPGPIEGVIQLTIYRQHADYAGSYVTYWKGYVRGARFKRDTGVIFAGLKTGSLKRFGLMRKFQRICGLPLYSTWCTVSKDNANYKITGTINIVNGATLDVTFAAEKPPTWEVNDWLKGGILKTDNGNCLQKIAYHIGPTIKISHSISGLIAGQTFVAWAGCDHLRTTCRTKFGVDVDPINGNVLNYGGQPYLPNKNPFTGDAVI